MEHMHNRIHIPVRFVTLVIVFLCLPLASCVYDQELQHLNDQVVALNRKVSNLEQTMDKRVGDDLGTMRSRQATMGADLDQIKGDMAKLSTRVQDNERIIKRTVERDLGEQDRIKETVEDLSKRVTRLERMVAHQQEYLGLEPPPGLLEEKVEGVPVPGQAEAAPVPGQAEPAPAPGVEEKRGEAPVEAPKDADILAYDRALALYREGKFEDAIEGFQAFLKDYPKSDRADNAQFWVGECYMNLKQYEKAILAFQEVIKKYPRGNKVPNALLRQAMAFLEIKDTTSSKLLLRKIIKNYPRSSEAEIARRKLATLK